MTTASENWRADFGAFLAGMGVTAVLQSSPATGLMTAGFAARGLVELVPALAIILGANVGTTLIVQVLSFDVAAASPALILVGVLMFRKASTTRAHDQGRVLIGLGLMLLALHQLLGLMTDYEDASSLRMLLGAVSTVPVADVLLAAGLTWAAHSSVAIVLLIMSLCAQNVVRPDAAFALVLGASRHCNQPAAGGNHRRRSGLETVAGGQSALAGRERRDGARSARATWTAHGHDGTGQRAGGGQFSYAVQPVPAGAVSVRTPARTAAAPAH